MNIFDQVVARAQTFDGFQLVLWDSGFLTPESGGKRGIGNFQKPRSETSKAAALLAGRLALQEADVWEMKEIARLYREARDLTKRYQEVTLADLRHRMRMHSDIFPFWEVLHRNDKGRVETRIWRFPYHSELHDLAIRHEQGRYLVFYTDRRDSEEILTSTGFEARDLDEAKSQALMVARHRSQGKGP